MSEEITGTTVYLSLDPDNLPALTNEDLEMLARLRELKEEYIDFSDIPSQAGRSDWTRPGKFGGALGRLRMKEFEDKVLLLEDGVPELFAGDMATRARKMNAVLREYGEAERKRA